MTFFTFWLIGMMFMAGAAKGERLSFNALNLIKLAGWPFFIGERIGSCMNSINSQNEKEDQ